MTEIPEEFYCPTLIQHYDDFLRMSIPADGALKHRYEFTKNIGYNFQYLEFLNHLLTEKNLHNTVSILSRKSFVITGMSIVEAILWYVLKKNNQQIREEWREIRKLKCNEYVEDGKKKRIILNLEEKLDIPVEVEMTLDVMRKKVESKKLLGVAIQVYKDLNHLRGLRNRVHIHVIQHELDTDWNKFSSSDVDLMKKALWSILSSDVFIHSKSKLDIFNYLKENST